MADIISFLDEVRSRRRRREQELAQHCVDLVELNLRLALELFHAAPAAERAIRARQVRQLSELLEYLAR